MCDEDDFTEDITIPVVVHFSLSDETECNLQQDDVYRWKAPDSLSESLFAELLLSLVIAVVKRDNSSFLKILDPPAKFIAELKSNAYYRTEKLSVSDTKAFQIVRDKVLGHEAFCCDPSEGNVTSLDIQIDSEVDPTGELREMINKKLDKETVLSEDEEFSAQFEAYQTEEVEILDKYLSGSEDNEEESDCEMEDEDLATPDKPCYFPSQIEMAAILKKRIDAIMEHYHNIAKLSDAFDDVDFVVYTARYRMLSDQTEKRIRHPHAGVLPRRERDPKDGSCEEKKMFMYIRSADTEKNHEDLQKKIRENPRTFFVIIADECHWGITKGSGLKPSAHNLFINEWCKDNPPRNTIVVQISATPFNLLTRNSRLPAVKCALVNQTTSKHQAGDLVVLESETGLTEEKRNKCKEMELHVAHWSEVELKNFETGMRMKLKSALQTEDNQSRYLSVSANGNLRVTSSESEANEFIVQGSQGIVTMKVLAKKDGEKTEMLTIMRNEDGTLKASAEPELEQATFEVKLEFGVGIVAFCWMQKRDHCVGVSESGVVTLQPARIERKCGVSIMRPANADLTRVSFEFYISSSASLAVKEAGHQYLSLNYYLGTVNCCYKQEKKIREDAFFQDIVDKAKRQGKMSKTFPVDALLCADYCYNILHKSVYKDEEKIRLQIVSGSQNDEFERQVSSFLEQLEKESNEPKRYFPREAFEFVQNELCNKVTQDYYEDLKRFQNSKHKSTSGISKEELTASYVACLMHLPNQDLREVCKQTPTNVMNQFRSNDCQTLLNIWEDIGNEGETSTMVADLISSGTTREGEMERGKMKILRAKSMETADKFFYTLRLARKVSGLADSFEVIRDYGGMQIETQMMKASSSFFQKLQTDHCRFGCGCKRLVRNPKRKTCDNCQHVHKPITQYEDLENLACVLILVDKGRMGDTFPQSFNCLDLRLSYDSNKEFKEGSAIFLSSLIQELGRMCRYAKVSVSDGLVENIPCALVGRALSKALEESLERSPAMSAISGTKPDRYMTRVKNGKRPEYCSRWLNYEASKDSFDHGNEETYCNRILLQAEPQIGKTGTYLCLIKQLRDDILQAQKPSTASADKLDEGSFYLYEESEQDWHSPDEFAVKEQDWQFPFWKRVQDSPSLLEKPVMPGKYSIGGCFYTHDMEECPFILMKERRQKPVKSSVHRQEVDVKGDGKQELRAWHWHHFENCAECGRLLQGKEPVVESIEVDISGTPVSVKCSFPTGCQVYRELRKKLKNFEPSEEDWGKLDDLTGDGDPFSLSYWIFHPSHRGDPRKCTLNYHHVMQENGQVRNYIQAVVVRSDKFEEYKSTWGKVLLILELPEKLPDCERSPTDGGVGYARLFIQKMAFALKLENIFVIDDNVVRMSEAVFSPDDKIVRNDDGVMKMQRCSFLKPLIHLQNLAQGKEPPPKAERHYTPHPLNEETDVQQFPLYSFTGPAKLFAGKNYESYGVVGLLRSVPTVKKPFAKTQVYAAILLNIKSTVEKNVFYRPWPCWEDLRFNDDCDKAGLWVVKFNRYLFLKIQHRDWIDDLAVPGIVPWSEDTVQTDESSLSEIPRDLEKSIILQHLRAVVDSEGRDMCFKGSIGCVDETNGEDSRFLDEALTDIKADIYNGEANPDGVPILVLSYYVSNVESKDISFLSSTFRKTGLRMIFVVSAVEANKIWRPISLGEIKSLRGLRSTSEMRNRRAEFAMFSAADPKRHRVRWILIEVSFPTQDHNQTRKHAGITAEAEGIPESNVDHKSIESKSTENASESHMEHADTDPKGVKRKLQDSCEGDGQQKRRKITDQKEMVQEECRDGDHEVSDHPDTNKNQAIFLSRENCPIIIDTPNGDQNVSADHVENTADKTKEKRQKDKKKNESNMELNKTNENASGTKQSFQGGKERGRKTERANKTGKKREKGGKRPPQGPKKVGQQRGLTTHDDATHSNAKTAFLASKKKRKENQGDKKKVKTTKKGLWRPSTTGNEETRRRQSDNSPSTSTASDHRSKSSQTRFDFDRLEERPIQKESNEDNHKQETHEHQSESSNAASDKNGQVNVGGEDDALSDYSPLTPRNTTSSILSFDLISAASSTGESSDGDIHKLETCEEQSESSNKDNFQLTSTGSDRRSTSSQPTWPNCDVDDDDDDDDDDVILVTSHTSIGQDKPRERKGIRSAITKLTPDDPAYVEGTNNVTRAIVDLWRAKQTDEFGRQEHKTYEEVQSKLDEFDIDQLQEKDGKGYTALLKACSLPSMSPHVMHYLIVTRKVDINCQVCFGFDEVHPAAMKLCPGMPALSVALRRGNVNHVTIFMKRKNAINMEISDADGNTALHHCILSTSKYAFDKLYPLCHFYKHKLNNARESALDIARELCKSGQLPKSKEQSVTSMLQEMEHTINFFMEEQSESSNGASDKVGQVHVGGEDGACYNNSPMTPTRFVHRSTTSTILSFDFDDEDDEDDEDFIFAESSTDESSDEDIDKLETNEEQSESSNEDHDSNFSSPDNSQLTCTVSDRGSTSSQPNCDVEEEGDDDVMFVTSCTSGGQDKPMERKETRSAITKLAPDDPAYIEGTNNVTRAIVDLWRAKPIDKNVGGQENKGYEEVQSKLDEFDIDQLQGKDGKGYTALLKACSLPSMSPHVMHYLIVKRNVDINCQIPFDFDVDHLAAMELCPGMSALSVALRRGNVSRVSTFMNRKYAINMESSDADGNTVLHHCILSTSKYAFDKLYPLCHYYKHKLNNARESALDIARKLCKSGQLPKSKQQSVTSMLQEMEHTINFQLTSTGSDRRSRSSQPTWPNCDVDDKDDDDVILVTSRTSSGQNNPRERKGTRSAITKLTPDDPAYLEGTNNVTRAIVDFWRVKQTDEFGVWYEEMLTKLDEFDIDQLQGKDGKGYTALLKACSLPTMNPHVMHYLIVKRNVDINCQLPFDFDKDHPAAMKLCPGMSALSVALRRGNVSHVTTFKKWQYAINMESSDADGNTVLHHCILSTSKPAFDIIYPLCHYYKHKRNNARESALDIARKLSKSGQLPKSKEQSVTSMLQEMK